MLNRFPQRVLLATDGAAGAALALHAAAEICTRADSELHLVHVWRTLESGPDTELRRQEACWLLRREILAAEAALGGEVKGYLREGMPAEEISALARELEAGLIVMGSRDLGPMERLVMGSVSEGVVNQAPCPVLVVRGGAWPPSRVVVGDDSSEGARRAGELAARIAVLLGATLQLVRAYPVVLDISEAARLSESIAVPLRVAMSRHEAALLGRARALEGVLGYRPRIRVMEGEAASVILATAEEGDGGPALIAVGRRGLGELDRLRLGSVSTKILRLSRGPVLICPA
ncbi:universal stress protein [Rubrobacter xylanophilus]|uniref:Universal stress protein n=1 Tax=Rubrobacter xylanophilus TaxID=49319 RepID=A0A510HKV7_9ACTN|nr:universal stress protein [Rubrobacter xylanophilus]BBL80602.1 universal stress protein [Rubrobacter xylanophilus]